MFQDGIIPFLEPMAVVSSRNEPVRALALTIGICQIAVLIGNVDAIAPLLRYVSQSVGQSARRTALPSY